MFNFLSKLKSRQALAAEALIVLCAFFGAVYGGTKLGANVDHSTTSIHGGHTLVVPGDSLGGFMSGSDKTKLDGLGMTMKGYADAWSTSNIGLLSGLANTVDGVTINTAGMVVCSAAQTTTTQDGCYLSASGSWTRLTQFAAGSAAHGATFTVVAGTSNKGVWAFTNTTGSDVVGTADLTAINVIPAGGSAFPPTGDLAMANHGFTGMRAGTTTGEGVTYEQVSQSILGQANGPLSQSNVTDEFDWPISAAANGTLVNGTVYGQGWRVGFAGTGAGVNLVTTNVDANHPGVLDLVAGTTASTGVANAIRGGVGTTVFGSGQKFEQHWLIRMPALFNNSTDIGVVRFGWVDNSSAPTNGLYYEFVPATSANWRPVSMVGSTPTLLSGGTAVPVPSDTWTHLSLIWDGTTATAKADGVTIGTTTTVDTTTPVSEAIAAINSTPIASTHHVLLDLYHKKMGWTTPRAN